MYVKKAEKDRPGRKTSLLAQQPHPIHIMWQCLVAWSAPDTSLRSGWVILSRFGSAHGPGFPQKVKRKLHGFGGAMQFRYSAAPFASFFQTVTHLLFRQVALFFAPQRFDVRVDWSLMALALHTRTMADIHSPLSNNIPHTINNYPSHAHRTRTPRWGLTAMTCRLPLFSSCGRAWGIPSLSRCSLLPLLFTGVCQGLLF